MIIDKIHRLLESKSFRKYLQSKHGKEDMSIGIDIKRRTTISYMLDKGLSEEETENVLKLLIEEGLVEESLHSNTVVCPYCNSTNVHSKYVCSHCKSLDITKNYIIQHLSCGGNFTTSSLSLDKCPKCKQPIKSSDELIISGGIFECKNCGYTFDMPHILFSCENDHSFTIREAQIKKINTYVIKKEADKVLDALFTYKTLSQELLKRGYHVEMPGSVIGASGVNHTFALVVKRDEKSDESIIIDLAGFIEDLNTDWIIKNYIKIMDIPNSKYVYVISKDSHEIENLIKGMPSKNIIILRAKTLDDIIEAIDKIFSEGAS